MLFIVQQTDGDNLSTYILYAPKTNKNIKDINKELLANNRDIGYVCTYIVI